MNFYTKTCQNEKSVIAKKGGRFEKDLLAMLGIPTVNGCAKAVSIIKMMMWLETCVLILVLDACEHCPNVEVEAFGLWLEKQL